MIRHVLPDRETYRLAYIYIELAFICIQNIFQTNSQKECKVNVWSSSVVLIKQQNYKWCYQHKYLFITKQNCDPKKQTKPFDLCKRVRMW